MSNYWIYLYLFLYLFSVTSLKPTGIKSFNVLFYDDNGTNVFNLQKYKTIWLRFDSNDEKSKIFWVKLKQNNVFEFPVLVKSNKVGENILNNQQTPTINSKCHYTAVSSFIPIISIEKENNNDKYITNEFQLVNNIASNNDVIKYKPISLCNGINGFVPLLNNKSYYAQIQSFQSITTANIGFINNSQPVDPDNMTFLAHNIEDKFGLIKRAKRSFQMPQRRNYDGPYLVELYLIVDSKMAAMYKSPQYTRLTDRIIGIINQINLAYSQLNIFFTIVQLEIWIVDQIKLTDENHILMELQMYKRSYATTKHDCLHAILGENIGSSKRGQAEPSSMCDITCVGYTKDYVGLNELELAHSVMHELGHNFGMQHDTELCHCYGCVMATGVEFSSCKFQWSQCSQREIRGLLKSGMARCLTDDPIKPTKRGQFLPVILGADRAKNKLNRIVSTSLCGNGVVDVGEECDCGSKEICSGTPASRCCNAETCKLRFRSYCAGGSCCDLATCSFQSAGTLCRLKRAEACDLPEYCNGQSEWCPSDLHKLDNSSCTNANTGDQSRCYLGRCESHSSRCVELWGPTGVRASSYCYQLNSGGGVIKNCGTDIPPYKTRYRQTSNWPIKQCQSTAESYVCGRLWCSHTNERVMFSSAIIAQHDQLVGRHQCSAVKFPLDGFMDDAGMVPNGAYCGYKKTCWNGECVASVSQTLSGLCYCSGHGVCNNLGHCHCDAGFAPPNCSLTGHGGSIDSGPPISFNFINRTIAMAILIPLIVLITILSVTLFIHHYCTSKWPSFITKLICDPLSAKSKKPENDTTSHSTNFVNNTTKPKNKLVIRTDYAEPIDEPEETYNSLLTPAQSPQIYFNIPCNRSPLVLSVNDNSSQSDSNKANPNYSNYSNNTGNHHNASRPILVPPKPFDNNHTFTYDKPKQNSTHKPLSVLPKPNLNIKPSKPSKILTPPKPNATSNNVASLASKFSTPKPDSTSIILTHPKPEKSSKILTPPKPDSTSIILTHPKPDKSSKILTPPKPNTTSKNVTSPAKSKVLTPPKPNSASNNLGSSSTSINRKFISPPILDHTTNTDDTHDIAAPDTTLARQIRPHKIVKVDPNSAVKYLQ